MASNDESSFDESTSGYPEEFSDEGSEIRRSAQDDDKSDEYDFDEPEIDLNSVPSWIDEGGDPKSNAPRNLDGNFNEALEEQQVPPDASELFGSDVPNVSMSQLIEQRDSYLEALRQLQADFENYKKRVIRDTQEDAHMKSVKLMEDLLPVLDNFQLALDAIHGDDETSDTVRKGIELVHADLMSVLERQGLESIDAQGALFDPELHDAVHHEDVGEHEHEVVVEVLRPGYRVRGRVVRPAMVRVAR